MKRVTEADLLVGKYIKKVRLERNKSAVFIANQCTFAHQQLAKYEGGVNRISAGAVTQIAKALGCDYIDLMPPDFFTEDSLLRKFLEIRGE